QVAAVMVRKAFMDRWAPEYMEVMRNAGSGKFLKHLPPFLIADTLHGSRTLLENSKRLRQSIVRHGRENENPIHFEQYADLAVKAVEDCANRFDETSGTKFTTFVHKRLRGTSIDYRRSKMESLDAILDASAKEGIKRADALGSLFRAVEPQSTGELLNTRHWHDDARAQIEYEANLNLFESVVFTNI